MAGWADKAKAGQSSVEGVISDYTFTDVFPMGEGNDEPGDNIYMTLEITPDGADEAVKRVMYLGSGQYLRIEDDGKTLVSSDEDGTPRLYDGGEVFKFIESLEGAGFPAEARFPDPNEEKKINFEAMIGWRIRLANEVDEESQMAIGKKKLGGKAGAATKEQILEAGKREVTKGKHKGKKFNRTFNKVTKVFGEADVPGAKAGKGTPAKSSKATKPVEDDAPDTDAADTFLTELVSEQKGEKIAKSGLPLAITRKCAKDKVASSERDALRKLLVDDAYLEGAAERGVIEYDPADKKGMISLA